MRDDKQHVLSRFASNINGSSARRRAMVAFARKHDLIYFDTVKSNHENITIIRGSTVTPGQVDSNYCIGTHAGYDMAVVERLASVGFGAYKTTLHRWYVLQIDLRSANNLPFIFIGTNQQTKAYYARLLATHSRLRYLALDSAAQRNAEFHGHYAVMASPSEVAVVYRLLSDDMIDMIAANRHPYAIEIEGDSLMIITEAIKPNQQLLDKLLHYGLWMAKEIDQRLS